MAEDEGVAKLRGFVAMLGDTANQVRDLTATVAAQTGELEEARSAAETALSELRGEMAEGEDDVGGAADEVEEALEELESNAGKLADDRLGEIAETIQTEANAFVRQAAEGADRLREAASDADSDGFKAAEAGIKKAEETVDEAKAALDEAFGQLALKIEQVGGEFADAVGAAGEKADEAAGEAKQQADEVKAKGDEVVGTLTQYVTAAPSVFGDLTEQVSTFFEGLGTRVTAEGDELVTAVQDALKGLHDVVETECAPSLGAAFQILLDETLPAATEELDEWIEALFAAQGAAGDFPATTEELREAKTTAESISEILQNSLGE